MLNLQKTNDTQVVALVCRCIYFVYYILLLQIENSLPHILDNEVVTKLFLLSFRDNFIIFAIYFVFKNSNFKYSLIIFFITLKNKISCVKNLIITLIIPLFSKSLFFSTIFHFAKVWKIFEFTKKIWKKYFENTFMMYQQ